MNTEIEGEGGAVHRALDLLKEQWKLIVAIAVLAVIASVAHSATQSKQYRSGVDVLFRDTSIAEQVTGTSVFQTPEGNSAAGSVMTTNIELLNSSTVANGVAEKLKVDSIPGQVSVYQTGLANIGHVEVHAGSPEEAQRIAQAWAEVFIAERQAADRAKLGQAIKLLRDRIVQAEQGPAKDSPVTAESRAQLQRLRLLQSVQDGGAEIVTPADLDPTAIAPRPKRSAVIAALLGLLLGLGIAVLRRTLDRRVKDGDQASALLQAPVLAEVPADAFDHDILHAPDARDRLAWQVVEEFRTLATNLRLLGARGNRRVLVITSAAPGEGKTTVTVNLGATLARMGRRVAVLDFDMRRGRLAQVFGIQAAAGTSSVLAGIVPADEAWHTVSNLDHAGTAELDVLSAGPPPPNPLELLSDEAARDLVSSAAGAHEYVLLDTSPALVVSDAVAVAQLADGIIVVVRMGQTTRDQLRRLRRNFDQASLRILGVVITGSPRKEVPYYGTAMGGDQRDNEPRRLLTSKR